MATRDMQLIEDTFYEEYEEIDMEIDSFPLLFERECTLSNLPHNAIKKPTHGFISERKRKQVAKLENENVSKKPCE